MLFAHRKVAVGGEEDPEATEALGPKLRQEPGEVTFEERDAYGYYVWLDVQPWKQWLFGLRYDWTEFPDGPGREWALEPYIAWMPSEFLRFRLGYKYSRPVQLRLGARHAQRAVPPGDLPSRGAPGAPVLRNLP